MKDSPKPDFRLLLDNIRSVHNVGSIFRTAETAGVSHICCIGTTPAPLDRFNRKRKDLAKVSLGAENLVPWEYVENNSTTIKKLVNELKKDNFQIIALEQDPKSVSYRSIKIGKKVLLILGNEVEGVDSNLLKLADTIAEIPLKGKKESLNVSVAAGIAVFQMLGI